MTTPYLSIVIPLYNKEKQIKRAIESVFQQEFTDWELIVINDGSTDQSRQIVESIKDNRIRVVNQNNAGVSSARNRGIYESSGKFIFLMDADDFLLPRAFDILKKEFESDIIVAGYIQTNNDGLVIRTHTNSVEGRISEPFKSLWKHEISMRMGNFFVKKEIINKQGTLREDLTLYEDHEWNLRLLENASVFSVNDLILNYQRGDSGLSRVIPPIEKDYAYIATIKKEKDKYKKRIIGHFVFRRFISRIVNGDFHGAKIIWKNNIGNMFYCFIMFIMRPSKK